ncbi:MAG: permease-like cell division protein FtsX [Clostridia bacterium]|nr:ABC transporter permease [Oscillospiraceae bacterium]MBR2410689.1 permease-like cell division protein FtsX [Clostridia bacterium]
MKNRNIRYLTHEGIRNIGINRLMSVASVAVLMSCLVIIGFAVLLFFNVDSLLQHIEAQNVVMVFCEVDATEQDIQLTDEKLKQIDNITSVEFVSKEEAFELIKASFDEDSKLLNNIDNSFLPAGFRVTVTDMALFDETVAKITAVETIADIQQNGDLASKLEEIRSAVTYISIGVIIVLFIVSMFIIANTVRITMFSRKLEISIMKAVGATNWFIRWPFLVEGVVLGIISSFVSFIVLALLYSLLSGPFSSIFGLLGNVVVSFWDYALILLGGFLVVSVLTGAVGSLISMRKYLKEQGSVVLDES